jgi:hypothetical protein
MTLPAVSIFRVDINDHHTHPQSNFSMAREFSDNGTAVEGPNGSLTLTNPWSESVSACSVLVKGCAENGWNFWQVEEPGHLFHGHLIDELRNREP